MSNGSQNRKKGSSRRRRRGRGRGGKGGKGGDRGASGDRRTISPEFWGDRSTVSPGEETVRITEDPAAVVRSLGSPPLAQHSTLAEHYFEAVYGQAVTVASALAAAGDLIEPEQLQADEQD